MSKEATKQKEGKPKFANPFRTTIRDAVQLHTVRVGEGAIKPEEAITREITLANGAVYEMTLRRIKPSQNVNVGAFDFPRQPRERKGINLVGGREISRKPTSSNP